MPRNRALSGPILLAICLACASSAPSLHKAARQGDAATVELLLDAGENPARPDGDGRTALHMAARAGHPAIIQRLVEAGGDTPAVIINISSVSRAGNMGQGNYSAAKAALIADTVTWAKELARYQIRVASIAPGFIETPILDGMRPEMVDMMVKQVPMRRLGKPAEIYAGVRFIMECEYFTGRCLDIDGGLRF